MDRVNELLSQYKYALLASLVGIVLITSGSITSLLAQPNQTPSIPSESIVEAKGSEMLKVDIAGAVVRPGVYELSKDKRVEDLIAEAGGFTDTVNKEYISKDLNLSQKISDGQKIYVPYKGEVAKPVMGTSTSTQKEKVNINTSTSIDLEVLPGIGPSTASKIVADRPYSSIQDLLTKKVLGKATFEKLKDLIEI